VCRGSFTWVWTTTSTNCGCREKLEAGRFVGHRHQQRPRVPAVSNPFAYVTLSLRSMTAMGQLRAIPAPEVPARSDPAANPAAIGCRAPISDLHRTSAPSCGEQRREHRAATVEALQRAVANPWTRICAALRSFNELRCFSPPPGAGVQIGVLIQAPPLMGAGLGGGERGAI
jgi:hypothetical protein